MHSWWKLERHRLQYQYHALNFAGWQIKGFSISLANSSSKAEHRILGHRFCLWNYFCFMKDFVMYLCYLFILICESHLVQMYAPFGWKFLLYYNILHACVYLPFFAEDWVENFKELPIQHDESYHIQTHSNICINIVICTMLWSLNWCVLRTALFSNWLLGVLNALNNWLFYH